MGQRVASTWRRHLFHISGAHSESGEDVELTVEGLDEAEACRRANQQGVYVAACTRLPEQVTAGAGQSQAAHTPG